MARINERLDKLEKATELSYDFSQHIKQMDFCLQKAYGKEGDENESLLLEIKTWTEWDRYVKAAIDMVYGKESTTTGNLAVDKGNS